MVGEKEESGYYANMHPLVEAFFAADGLGKGIFFILFSLSILTWSLLLQKIALCRDCQRAMALFDPRSPILQQNDLYGALYKTYQASKKDHSQSDMLLSSKRRELRKGLEKGMFLLPTVASLSPFLGLLGTVWGILLTFYELRHGVVAQGNTAVMGGLATALGTTVVGLIVAIPALISYNYLRAQIRSLSLDMDTFAERLLAKESHE